MAQEISYIPTCLLDHEVEEVIDAALYALREAGSQPIEWGALLEVRMNTPSLVRNFSYIVDDQKLESASEILMGIGLPFMPPTDFEVKTGGQFRTNGRFHRITHNVDPSGIQHMVLYPRSFIPLLPDELEDVPSIHLTPSSLSPRAIAPKPHATYAALIRMLVTYPYMCSTRRRIQSSLELLINYHLLGFEDGCCPNIEDEDEYWAARYPDLAAKALITLREWKCEGVWADGEDWIGDALAAFVEGNGDMMHLSLSRRSGP